MRQNYSNPPQPHPQSKKVWYLFLFLGGVVACPGVNSHFFHVPSLLWCVRREKQSAWNSCSHRKRPTELRWPPGWLDVRETRSFQSKIFGPTRLARFVWVSVMLLGNCLANWLCKVMLHFNACRNTLFPGRMIHHTCGGDKLDKLTWSDFDPKKCFPFPLQSEKNPSKIPDRGTVQESLCAVLFCVFCIEEMINSVLCCETIDLVGKVQHTSFLCWETISMHAAMHWFSSFNNFRWEQDCVNPLCHKLHLFLCTVAVLAFVTWSLTKNEIHCENFASFEKGAK